MGTQVSPRRVGKSKREVQLEKKARLQYWKIRRQKQKIKHVTELVSKLKEAGKCDGNLDDILCSNFSGLN